MFYKTDNTDEVWNGTEWKSYNTTPYERIYGAEACTTKVNRDTYIIMGGHGNNAGTRVLEFKLTGQTFTELPNLINDSRYHGEELVLGEHIVARSRQFRHAEEC